MSEYIRRYGNFRGVDFSSDPAEVADYRFCHAENVWKDYAAWNGNAVETIPGYRLINNFKERIYGIHKVRLPIPTGADEEGGYADYIIVHAGKNLFYKKVEEMEDENIIWRKVFSDPYKEEGEDYNTEAYMLEKESNSVVFNNQLFVIDGNRILIISLRFVNGINVLKAEIIVSDTKDTIVENVCYIPTIYRDGEKFEQPNLISKLAKEVYNNIDVSPYIDTTDTKAIAKYTLIAAFETIRKVTLNGKTVNPLPGTVTIKGLYYSFEEGVLTLQKMIKKEDGTFEQTDITEDDIKEKILEVTGKYTPYIASLMSDEVFIKTDLDTFTAIGGCTQICVFDQRIFLMGNPLLPNTVFFSYPIEDSKGRPYFGAYNWIDTGVENTLNKAFLNASSTLIVIKEQSSQEASVYYLTPSSTGQDLTARVYQRSEGIAGIGAIGPAINFMDDAVFLSKRGLESISKQATNLERSISHRSYNVDRRLIVEDLSKARMTEWCGYLVISVGGRMYLADSRAMYTDDTGNVQYEWFYLDGIGSYDDEDLEDQYRYYSGACDNGYKVKPENNEEIVVGTVSHDDNGIYYSEEKDENGDPVYYICYLDEEKVIKPDAKFYPAEHLCVINDVLFFSTSNGHLLCFNTDKRGELADYLLDENGNWTTNQYEDAAELAYDIPMKYYSRNHTRYVSGVITKSDYAKYDYMKKNTVPRSLLVKVGVSPTMETRVKVEVKTDVRSFHEVGEAHASGYQYEEYSFNVSTFNTAGQTMLSFNEHERGWIEKQYKIFTDDFCSVLRLHSLTYRYEIADHIR